MFQRELVLTAGYSGHDLGSFLAKLRQHNVEVVVDVRQNPVSRKKGFSRGTLSAYLTAHEIEYVHEAELGVPIELRKQLSGGKQSLLSYFDRFKKYLAGRGDALDRLYRLATKKRCCLICVERAAAECHRSIVTEALETRNGRALKVVHL
jgi:uncharacterized protein (DUF488 family)